MKSVFKIGFMYKLSCSPSVYFYVAENKTLAGREERTYEGEALGRKLAIAFFEAAAGGLVQRVNQEDLTLKPQLLTLAELLQTCGVAVPRDAEQSAAATELLFENCFQDLELTRFDCTEEPEAGVHFYSLSEEVSAEGAFVCEAAPEQRVKMALARCLQRNEALNEDETLAGAWSLGLAALQARAAPFLPAPPAPPAPAAPRGKAKAKGEKGKGKGEKGKAKGEKGKAAKGRGGGGRGKGRG